MARGRDERRRVELRQKIEPLRADPAGGVAQFGGNAPGVQLGIEGEQRVRIPGGSCGVGTGKEGNLEGEQRRQDLFGEEGFKIGRSADYPGLDEFFQAERVGVGAGGIGGVVGLKQPEPGVGGHFGAWGKIDEQEETEETEDGFCFLSSLLFESVSGFEVKRKVRAI